MLEAKLQSHIQMIYGTVTNSVAWHDFLTDICSDLNLKPTQLLLYAGGSAIENKLLEASSENVTHHYLHKLVPHIKRALAMRQKLETDQFYFRLNQTIQNSVGHFSLFVGTDKKIVPSTSDLDTLLDKIKLSTSQDYELKSIEGITIHDLNQAIDKALYATDTEQDLTITSFIVHHKCKYEELIWLIEISRFQSLQSASGHPLFSNKDEILAQITLRELSRKDDGLAGRLINLFELSSSEVDVAILLAQGYSPNYIAESRSRSIDTIRTQIKQISAKMGVKKTTDMIILINNLSI